MTPELALFSEPSPGRLQARAGAVGPHDPAALAGGALGAAVVTVARHAGRDDLRLARGTWRFPRVARLEAPLDWSSETRREGSRVVEERIALRQSGHLVCAGHLTWLRTTPGAFPVAATLRARPTEEHPDPIPAWNDGYFGGALEVRADGFDGIGAGRARLRLRTAVVEGRPVLPAAVAVGAADNAHGIGAPIDRWPPSHPFVNPDLDVCLARDPQGEWLDLDVQSLWPGDGTGLAVGTIADRDGPLGVVTQTQVLTRAAPRLPEEPGSDRR